MRTISYTQTIAIEAFLGYLHNHYSKSIDARDTYLIAAVGAWFFEESGGHPIGNNPFNIRPGIASFLSNGTRNEHYDGKFLTFASLAKGFEAAAYLLIHASKSFGYQLALNALKNGGNQAAVDFLAALAMSSWDGGRYGATDWLSAYDANKNHLLAVYTTIKAVQLTNPHQRTAKPPKPAPKLPVDHFAQKIKRDYLDPWAAGTMYTGRHRHAGLSQKVDGAGARR